VRGLRYHLRCWGDPQSPKLFLLHMADGDNIGVLLEFARS